jgi:hypothetical protein
MAKQEDWGNALPKPEEPVPTATIGMDGTCPLRGEDGRRQHTIYMAATPEYGKATFLDRMERGIGRVKAAYPQARYVGLADGAKGNWEFLGRHIPLPRSGGGPLALRSLAAERTGPLGPRPDRRQPARDGRPARDVAAGG